MSDIASRLYASVAHGAYNGNAEERAICGAQMREAAEEITRLHQKIEDLDRKLRRSHRWQEMVCPAIGITKLRLHEDNPDAAYRALQDLCRDLDTLEQEPL